MHPTPNHTSYNGHWRNVVQQLAYLGSLLVYLENESLLTLEDFQALLGGACLPSSRRSGVLFWLRTSRRSGICILAQN